MKADYLSYKRATSVSLLGLTIQLVMGLALLVYAIQSRSPDPRFPGAGDHAAMTAAAFALLGTLVWLSLAIVFDQHRRERIEAAEAENFAASDAAGSSVFDQASEDLRVAAKRLRVMHKIFLPTVGLLLGAAMIAVGLWRFSSGQRQLSEESFPPPRLWYWGLGIGLAIAVVGFIFARFVSGMAKQKVWANLRGGAAYAVGTAILGLALAVGHFVDIAGPDAVSRYNQVVFPAVMVVLGLEIFLNFVLDVYRPRKAGELPRPAFDSRILGFAAAPDRVAASISEAINYQFGYNVTSSWLYQLLARWVLALVVFGGVVLWLMSSFTVIQPHQSGIVLRFGNYQRTIGPGLHVKAPWPIDTVEVPVYVRVEGEKGKEVRTQTHTTTGIRTLHLLTRPPANKGPVLWTNEHATEEVFSIVQPPAGAPGAVSGQGRDLALVSAEVPLRYVIKDAAKYDRFAPPDDRDKILTAVAQRVLIRDMATLSVDQILGGGRQELADRVRGRLNKTFDDLDSGVEIVSVSVEGVHPAKIVAPAFEGVVSAAQRKEANRLSAEAEAIGILTRVVGTKAAAGAINREIAELDRLRSTSAADAKMSEDDLQNKIIEQAIKLKELIAKAGGEAGALVSRARADRWRTHMDARGRAARYEGQLALYNASPVVYKAGLYFEALKAAMAGSRVYITSEKPWVSLDVKDVPDAGAVFNPKGDEDK